MLKNLLFILFFVQVHHANPVIKPLDSKFNLSENDNIIYIFQSKHKRDKLTQKEIKDSAFMVIKKLHQWKVSSAKIVQIIHIKGLPRFVPQKIIRKKLNKKAKAFTNLLLPMLNEEERKSFHDLEFHWYIDQGKNFFKDLNLSLNEAHLFVKSKGNPLKKSSPTLLKQSDFGGNQASIKSQTITKP